MGNGIKMANRELYVESDTPKAQLIATRHVHCKGKGS